MMDTNKIIQKTISWQTISTIIAILYTWWWFGEFASSVALILTELIILSAVYYLHEKFWGRNTHE